MSCQKTLSPRARLRSRSSLKSQPSLPKKTAQKVLFRSQSQNKRQSQHKHQSQCPSFQCVKNLRRKANLTFSRNLSRLKMSKISLAAFLPQKMTTARCHWESRLTRLCWSRIQSILTNHCLSKLARTTHSWIPPRAKARWLLNLVKNSLIIRQQQNSSPLTSLQIFSP